MEGSVKIAVIGYSGSGKSTLAKQLAGKTGCAPLYLDTVNFLPDWRERNRDEARERVRRELEKPNWVIDGNYRALLHAERMEQADEIVWMNYPRLLCLIRALKRYASFRGKTRESAADGCIERMTWEFAWWILYKGRTRERVRGYRTLAVRYPGKTVIVRNDRECSVYIAGLTRQGAGQS
jgi:adenylate kinase family enzyme